MQTYTVVWDPVTRSKVHDIELVQNSAIRFISNLKGGTHHASEARNELGLWLLENKRKNSLAEFTEMDCLGGLVLNSIQSV